MIADRNLQLLWHIKLSEKCKSGYFANENAFIYNTKTNIWYLLTNGSTGIIHTFN